MNFLVMTNNSGKMPVLDDSSWIDTGHFSYQDKEEISYSIFSDKFILGNYIYSLGDFFMIFGLLILLIISIILIYLNNKVKKLYKEERIWEIQYK